MDSHKSMRLRKFSKSGHLHRTTVQTKKWKTAYLPSASARRFTERGFGETGELKDSAKGVRVLFALTSVLANASRIFIVSPHPLSIKRLALVLGILPALHFFDLLCTCSQVTYLSQVVFFFPLPVNFRQHWCFWKEFSSLTQFHLASAGRQIAKMLTTIILQVITNSRRKYCYNSVGGMTLSRSRNRKKSINYDTIIVLHFKKSPRMPL